MTHPTTTFPPAAVEALRRTVAGLIVYPTDPTYADLTGGTDPSALPDVVVVPASEAAVAAAVDVARAHGLLVRPHLGRPAMLVLTHRLDGFDADVEAGTATAGPGAALPDGRRIADAAASGDVAVLSARVVRADGFVHVVAHPARPADDADPWIVTAVVVPLDPTQLHTHHQDQEVPS